MDNHPKVKSKSLAPFSMEEKLDFLRQPSAWPDPVRRVETIETHMSWVFLTEKFAYKLKKPVRSRFADLRIPDARLRNCRQEVLLNRRLAPHIYLGIIPLLADEQGRLTLHGNGRIVDWLVRMKRIDDERLLDHAIKAGSVTDRQLSRSAGLLVDFYIHQPVIPMPTGAYRERLRADIQATHQRLIEPQYHLPIREVNRLTAGLLSFLSSNSVLIDGRAGYIKELHGDLRPEHVCLGPKPAFIDCLEFSRDLRLQDIADELAFLFVECTLLGATSVEKIFLQTYEKAAGDHIPASLLAFYKLKRCCLRAWLTARHIDDPGYRHETKWLAKAKAYLTLGDTFLSLSHLSRNARAS